MAVQAAALDPARPAAPVGEPNPALAGKAPPEPTLPRAIIRTIDGYRSLNNVQLQAAEQNMLERLRRSNIPDEQMIFEEQIRNIRREMHRRYLDPALAGAGAGHPALDAREAVRQQATEEQYRREAAALHADVGAMDTEDIRYHLNRLRDRVAAQGHGNAAITADLNRQIAEGQNILHMRLAQAHEGFNQEQLQLHIQHLRRQLADLLPDAPYEERTRLQQELTDAELEVVNRQAQIARLGTEPNYADMNMRQLGDEIGRIEDQQRNTLPHEIGRRTELEERHAAAERERQNRIAAAPAEPTPAYGSEDSEAIARPDDARPADPAPEEAFGE
jgi:hypothetical protein